MEPTQSATLSSSSRIAALRWSLGAPVLGVGCLALVFGIVRKIPPAPENNSALEKEVAGLEKKVGDLEQNYRTLCEARNAKATELLAKREEHARLAAQTEKRLGEVRKLEDANAQRIAALRSETDTLRRQTQADVESANRVLREAGRREQQQQRVQNTAAKFTHSVVTVLSQDNKIRSGFFIGGYNRPLCVTVTGGAASEVPTQLKMRFQPTPDSEYQVSVSRARLLHRDPRSGITILTFDVLGKLTLTAVPLEGMAKARQGDKILTISSQVVGDQLLENNVFEGDVSAVDRKLGEITVLQTSIPANPGATGSPVFNADGRLIGVLLGQLSEMERVSVTIPAEQLLNALKTLEGK